MHKSNNHKDHGIPGQKMCTEIISGDLLSTRLQLTEHPKQLLPMEAISEQTKEPASIHPRKPLMLNLHGHTAAEEKMV